MSVNTSTSTIVSSNMTEDTSDRDFSSSASPLGSWYKPIHENSEGEFNNKKDGTLEQPFCECSILAESFCSPFAMNASSPSYSVSSKFYDSFPHLE